MCILCCGYRKEEPVELQPRMLRTNRRMTQTEFAKSIGTTLRGVSAWKRNETKISLGYAYRIAGVFNVSLDELAGRWEYVGMASDATAKR